MEVEAISRGNSKVEALGNRDWFLISVVTAAKIAAHEAECVISERIYMQPRFCFVRGKII